MINLTDWSKGDKLSASHLMEAWKALRQYLPITGGKGVRIHSSAFGGTTIDVDVEHQSAESIDAEIIAHGDGGTPYWQDPRYYLQAIEVTQASTAIGEHDTPPIALDANYVNRSPAAKFMAWNLAETLWGSHFLHIGDRVTVHKIETSVVGGGQPVVWWVFSRNPDPIRSATVATTPDTCASTVDAIDEYQTLSGNLAHCTITISENLATAGANLLTAPSTVIHYIPDSANSGFILGYIPMLSVGTACDVETSFGDWSMVIIATNFLAFNGDDFHVGAQSSDSTGCNDIAGIIYNGFTVTATIVGTTAAPDQQLCQVKWLNFGSAYTSMPPADDHCLYVTFDVTQPDAVANSCLSCDPGTQKPAQIKAKAFLAPGGLCAWLVANGFNDLVFTPSCNTDGTVSFTLSCS